ncbi:MAG: phytanoyl-CoA dioxygenase family protein [Flavobacteriaceae bacterium]
MSSYLKHTKELEAQGFSIAENIFSEIELQNLIQLIESNSSDFSIRQLVNRVPEIQKVIFENQSFRDLFDSICDKRYFLSKAIYFNKPSKSNWFVGYHQDMSISVKNKLDKEGYSNWTNKKGQLGVIPPVDILENTVTFRIHLDDTDNSNGALKVVSSSHSKGIIRIDEDFQKNSYGEEVVCNVIKGGVMLMKPLLLHASLKSISEEDRRVIHLEFSNQEIPMGWLEKKKIS